MKNLNKRHFEKTITTPVVDSVWLSSSQFQYSNYNPSGVLWT